MGTARRICGRRCERIGALGEVKAVSSFYDTEPVGYLDQPRFLNGALLLETELGPLELMRGCWGWSGRWGGSVRARCAKGPRVIDLDLLLYGDWVVMETEELTLPHPEMAGAEVCAGAAGGDCAGVDASGDLG